MKWLLDTVYAAGLLAYGPRLLYRRLRHGRYRRGWAERLWGRVPRRGGGRPCVWFHAVSVGEVNLLRPLAAELQQHWPQWDVALSTSTDAGYDLARRRFPHWQVFFCPMDFSWAVREAFCRIRPQMLVLVELELWPQLLAEAAHWNAPVAVINARLSPRSFRGYRLLGPLVRRMLGRVQLVAAQSETYAQRFRRLGAAAERVHVTGSLKFDGVQTDPGNRQTQALRRLAGIAPDHVVLLAGSTQAEEEHLVLQTYRQLRPRCPQLRLVLVPRHPERFDAVARWLKQQQVPVVRRSRLQLQERPLAAAQPPVLLVDTVGELGAWWGTAQVALVGGSFGRRGGQNMIEPAAYGAAVCFGPRTENFRDVVALLLEHDAACVVRNQQELTDFVRRCLEEPAWAQALGRRAQQLVLSQQGAAARTRRLLERLQAQRLLSPLAGRAA